jgi:hypothetical protein
MGAQENDPLANSEHGLKYILKRVKDGLADAAKSLVGAEDTAANVRDYLPLKDPDHLMVMSYIKHIEQRYDDNPELARKGWEEIHLPGAVEGQGGRVSRAQAGRLLATLSFRYDRNNPEDISAEGAA